MRIISSFVAAIAIFSAGIGFAAADGCIDDLAVINRNEANVKNIHRTRTYILCPNTVFKISDNYDFSTGRIKDGKQNPPITLYNPNVKILCGSNGAYENDCVFRGGEVQIKIASPSVYEDLGADIGRRDVFLDNIEISGVQFKASVEPNVLVVSPGDVTFKDVYFLDNTNQANIYIADYFCVIHYEEYFGKDDKKYGMKVCENNHPIIVSVLESTFQDNTVGFSKKDYAGLITAIGPERAPTHVLVEESTFINNNFEANFQNDEFTYMIGNFYGEMTVRKTCFIHNSVSLTLILNNRGFLDNIKNYEDENDEGNFGCLGVANVRKGDIFVERTNNLEWRCFPLTSSDCLSGFQIPTPEPTEEPTEEPTDEPTEEPTDEPTEEPTDEPTEEPTDEPTEEPTDEPTEEPTDEPTEEPTEEPTDEPTEEPTEEPTDEPTEEPTEEPTDEPTEEPTMAPTCNDEPGKVVRTRQESDKTRDCVWLKKSNKALRDFYCADVEEAQDACPETCDLCDDVTKEDDKKYYKCADDAHATFPFYVHVNERCDWIGDQRRSVRNEFCAKGSRTYRLCKKTCGAC